MVASRQGHRKDADEGGDHGDTSRRPMVRVGGRWHADERRQNRCLGATAAFRDDLGHHSRWQPDITVSSEVEVKFIAEGANATRVELEHRKFERMGAEPGEKMRKDVDGGWPGLLERFKSETEAR
jgi:hypothetical protein